MSESGTRRRGRPLSAGSNTSSFDTRSTRSGGIDSREMASDLFADENIQVVEESASVDQKKQGFWKNFKSGLRGIWSTRQSDEGNEDPDWLIKTTLRELIIYFIFLVVLVILVFGMANSTMYYYTSIMSGLYLDNSIPGSSSTFRSIGSKGDLFKYMRNTLMDGLYWETQYNGESLPEDDQGYIFYENKLLGIPRLRMLRVKDDSCVITKELRSVIPKCYSSYSQSNENRAPFGDTNNSAFHYRDDLDAGSHWGIISKYGDGGYVQDLGKNRTSSERVLAELEEHLWLDRGSRVLFIDFTIYNANINLFSVIRLIAEMPATGGVITSWSIKTVKLIRYVTGMDYFVLACECLFVLFILYYSIEEAIEIKRHKLAYFKQFWNVLDVTVIIISVLCIVFNIYRSFAVNAQLEDLVANPDSFPDMDSLAYWQMTFNNAVAVTVFLAWIKVFKYISFNKTMTQLSSTLDRCAKDIAGFAIMFFIVFFAFAQLGTLMFGALVKDFRSAGDACLTLFRIILGDFDYYSLEAANRVLGPCFFFLYVFFVFFVLLNMFLAIINDTYSEVKSDLEDQPNEFEMGDFLKKNYNKMMDKLSVRRDKIIDIQKALKGADANDDQVVDFDEWRQQLKMRGYADCEIEAIFSKYDADGDQKLNSAEQQKMREDLEGQRESLDRELDDMENGELSHSDADGEEDDDHGSDGKDSGISNNRFNRLSKRVERIDCSVGDVVSKLDVVLTKLEKNEETQRKRLQTMTTIISTVSQTSGDDLRKRRQVEELVIEELKTWQGNVQK